MLQGKRNIGVSQIKILSKLEEAANKEYKYKELCQALDLPIKTGKAKQLQLNQLKNYCHITKLERPTRYKIDQIYNEALSVFNTLNKNNKFQLMFEAALYQKFLEQNGGPLYVSNLDLLKLFQEVNENFSYACNFDYMKALGKEFEYMASMGEIIYRILLQWTLRRINQMDARRIVLKRNGFRLYKKYYIEGKEYSQIYNIPFESNEEKICQQIWDKARYEIMPPGWGNDIQDTTDLQLSELKRGRFWVPQEQYVAFQNRIIDLVKEKFNEKYNDMKSIYILSAPTNEWIKKELSSLCNQLEALTNINSEACKKALTTSQLDSYTGEQRKEFIHYNMNQNPPFLFKDKIKKM